jgi:acetylglutamate/LysW-gamma-L-alpha-aminoadipate kinase
LLIVVKIGGSLLREAIQEPILSDIEKLSDEHQIVLAHGGGAVVTELSQRLGKEPRFVTSPKGFRSRYTDREEAEIFTMVMTGKIGKDLVSGLQRHNVDAIGLSGLDGHLVRAERKEKLIVIDERGRRRLIEGGYTGKVKSINHKLLKNILSEGYLPVISPVAIGNNYESLNVDGDRMAASIAGSLEANILVLLTDVAGVRLNDRLVKRMTLNEAQIQMEKLGPGMITKVYAATEALRNGVQEVIIGAGSIDHPITSALEHENCTVITK